MDFLKKFGFGKAVFGGVGLLASILIVIYLGLKLAVPPMAILYTNMSESDIAIVSSRLQAMGVPYEVGGSGKELLAPVSKILMLRMSFAQEGIPSTGNIVGYEIFDKSEGIGTSQFVYNVNLVRALEGELARTIGSLTPIESARVHLVLPKRELFAKANNDPSASVVVKLRGSQALTKGEVAGISHIILTAVPGMKLDNISIIDNRGRPLKLANGEESNIGAMTETASDYQHLIEERLRATIEEMLEKSVGIGKIKATINAEINFDREVMNTEQYDPDGQVVRSRKVSEENDKDSSQQNNLSASTNITNPASEGASGAKSKSRTDEIINYEISKTITNKISESGRIKKLSIAILVDGNYTISQDEATGEQKATYSPRSPEELAQIKTLASSAVGLDPKRGDMIEVINMKFSEEFSSLPAKESPLHWIKDQLDNIVQTLVIGVVIILVILLIVRPVIMRLLEMRSSQSEEDEIQASLSSSAQQVIERARAQNPDALNSDISEEDLTHLSPEERKRHTLIRHANELADKHPDETVAIIRNWLYSSE